MLRAFKIITLIRYGASTIKEIFKSKKDKSAYSETGAEKDLNREIENLKRQIETLKRGR